MEHYVPTEGAKLSGAQLMLMRDRERTELWRDLFIGAEGAQQLYAAQTLRQKDREKNYLQMLFVYLCMISHN